MVYDFDFPKHIKLINKFIVFLFDINQILFISLCQNIRIQKVLIAKTPQAITKL